MRARFLVGIVAENPKAPMPIDALDFIDWNRKTADGKQILLMRFCPFCGKPYTAEQALRIPNPEDS